MHPICVAKTWLMAAAACLVMTCAMAAQESYITVVIEKDGAPGLLIGYRTSDPGASFVSCTITGSSQTCSKHNGNSSIPKNLGNVLCLPAAQVKFTVTPRCQTLINAGSGNCQANSSAGKCPSGTTAIMPACNYRTSSNASNTANWVWNVVNAGACTTSTACKPAIRGRTPNESARRHNRLSSRPRSVRGIGRSLNGCLPTANFRQGNFAVDLLTRHTARL